MFVVDEHGESIPGPATLSKMTRVLLIRHGETSWNREGRWQGHTDVPLSDEGVRQAQALADAFRSYASAIPVVYSSDLRRARDTALLVGAAIGIVPVLDPVWREMDVGRWSGLSRDEIQGCYPDEWARILSGEDLVRGGGETFGQFFARIIGALDSLSRRHDGETVAVVTHGGVIRAALLHALGLPFERLREVSIVENATLTELRSNRSGWEIASRNERAPL